MNQFNDFVLYLVLYQFDQYYNSACRLFGHPEGRHVYLPPTVGAGLDLQLKRHMYARE